MRVRAREAVIAERIPGARHKSWVGLRLGRSDERRAWFAPIGTHPSCFCAHASAARERGCDGKCALKSTASNAVVLEYRSGAHRWSQHKPHPVLTRESPVHSIHLLRYLLVISVRWSVCL